MLYSKYERSEINATMACVAAASKSDDGCCIDTAVATLLGRKYHRLGGKMGKIFPELGKNGSGVTGQMLKKNLYV